MNENDGVRSTAPGVIGVIAVLLAGCGASGGATTSAGRVTSTATVTVTTPGSTGTGTTTPATPSTTGGTPACTASDLTPVFRSSNGAAGTIVLTLSLRNSGSGPCHTYGYPGVAFLDQSGGRLPTRPTHTTHDVLGSVVKAEVTLTPGKAASFRLTTNDAAGGGGPPTCARAYGVQLIAPDDTVPMRLTLPFALGECRAVTVTPLSR